MLFVRSVFPPTNFHEPTHNDPAGWHASSYVAHPIDLIEPTTDVENPFREYSLGWMKTLAAIDQFLMTSRDPRLAWIAVAVVLRLTSVRGLSVGNIAAQLGCSEAAVNHATARFRRLTEGLASRSRSGIERETETGSDVRREGALPSRIRSTRLPRSNGVNGSGNLSVALCDIQPAFRRRTGRRTLPTYLKRDKKSSEFEDFISNKDLAPEYPPPRRRRLALACLYRPPIL